MQLAARGIVQVSSRRGWFVVQPSKTEAREAFEARKVIETGLIRSAGAMDKATLKRLKQHIQQEKTALKQDDVGRRSFLLGDFHVRMAELMNSDVLAQVLGELISRCALITLMYQSRNEAEHSTDEHVAIVAALEAQDSDLAVRLMHEHLLHVEASLTFDRKVPTHDISLALA